MILYNEESHSYYTEAGLPLVSVTQLIRKHGLGPDYGFIPQSKLDLAAGKGTAVHAEIEDFLSIGEIGFTPELEQFISLWNKKKRTDVQTEQIIGYDCYAGRYDLMYKEGNKTILADVKTTSSIHHTSLSWQLSLYAYALEKAGTAIDGLACYWLPSAKKGKLIEIERISNEEIEGLLYCEKAGEPFTAKTKTLVLAEGMEATAVQVIKEIAYLEGQLKAAKALSDKIKEQLLLQMQENGVKKFEGAGLKLTYVDAYEKETIDSTRLKDEEPEVAKKYTKISIVKPSIRMSLVEES